MAIIEGINFARMTSLALADSVNPCAIAILIMVLVTIMIQNPERKRKVLYAGLAFVTSVYIGYLLYGLIIVEFFQVFAVWLRESSHYVYDGLSILAMILGGLNIRDYFHYQPGGIATEMPLFMRPRVKLIIQKMTSPLGAFVIGFLVTLFLLPCTIGPYIIASGLLAELGIAGALPWLIYYNLVFILPMIAITLLIYFGLSKIEDVEGWKARNIRRLHLIAGTLLFLVGFSLLIGWL